MRFNFPSNRPRAAAAAAGYTAVPVAARALAVVPGLARPRTGVRVALLAALAGLRLACGVLGWRCVVLHVELRSLLGWLNAQRAGGQ